MVLPLALGVVEPPAAGWHAQTLAEAFGYMLLFGVGGILLAIVGYMLFDKCAPGELPRETFVSKTTVAKGR